MSLIKLSAGNDQYWLMNDIPHQRGQFDVSAKIGEDVVEIYSLNTLKSLARGKYDEFSPDGITPYASTQALIDDLKAFFFHSLTGGGTGAVDSVNGQTGVVVLDADDIDDTTTSNKFVTAADLTKLSNTSGTNTGDETTLSIQTKRPLKTVNLQSLEGTGDISISGFDPVAEGVLTGYLDSQNTATQTTNATQPSLATYLTLVATGIDITSDYRFEVSFSISHDATNSNAIVDIKDFGVSILPQVYTVEPKDNSNRKWITISGRITPNPLGAGQIQLQLDFGTDDPADDTTMYFANISLSKIN